MRYLNPRTYLSSFYHKVYGNNLQFTYHAWETKTWHLTSLHFLVLTIFVLFRVNHLLHILILLVWFLLLVWILLLVWFLLLHLNLLLLLLLCHQKVKKLWLLILLHLLKISLIKLSMIMNVERIFQAHAKAHMNTSHQPMSIKEVNH